MSTSFALMSLTLGGITLLAPLSLLGLVALPLIWWILKITPPKPLQRIFPPLRLLQQVKTDEETPSGAPLWLLLFRLALISLIVFALSLPIIKQNEGVTQRPITMLLDTHWSAAPNWNALTREAETRLKDARRKNLSVRLITTTEPRGQDELPNFMPAELALDKLSSLQPEALPFDSTYVEKVLGAAEVKYDIGATDLLWISGGSDTSMMDGAAAILNKAANKKRILPLPSQSPIIIGEVTETADGFNAIIHRAQTAAPRSVSIEARGRDGRLIATETVNFDPGQKEAQARFRLPPNLRRRIANLRSPNSRSAGAIRLFDDSWGRPMIGLLAPSGDTASPLLSEPFYTQSALDPFADIFVGDLDYLLGLAPEIIIMPDVARTTDKTLIDYVERGGMLIRFAGPKLAARSDKLLPVRLRSENGARAFGGALTWEEPQNLAPFSKESPFFGLKISNDIQIKRQVMAAASAETDSKTWARLIDGSPIVTAAPRELGQVVLFHITASPEWSNLALSGLYVDMLRRILPLAGQSRRENIAATGDWSPDKTLSGFGQLNNPNIEAISLASDKIEQAEISRTHPAGLYRQGQRLKARNMISNPSLYDVQTAADKLPTERLGGSKDNNLTGRILAIALGLLALDVLFSLLASGRLKPRGLSRLAVIGLALMIIPMTEAHAQDGPDVAIDLHLAYIQTGNARVDALSEDAMRGLVKELNARTTIEPAGVRAVDPENDTLSYFPFIYWPVKANVAPLSDEEAAALNDYMATGGTLLIDTRDFEDRSFIADTPHPGLKTIGEKLDIPPLADIQENHVLRKSFYLLDEFVGRWAGSPLWVDSDNQSLERDGVSAVIITGNDLASAWAIDSDGKHYIDVENDIPRQREFAIRFGINIAMYALSGNYKADQVHAAALIERLGKNKEESER